MRCSICRLPLRVQRAARLPGARHRRAAGRAVCLRARTACPCEPCPRRRGGHRALGRAPALQRRVLRSGARATSRGRFCRSTWPTPSRAREPRATSCPASLESLAVAPANIDATSPAGTRRKRAGSSSVRADVRRRMGDADARARTCTGRRGQMGSIEASRSCCPPCTRAARTEATPSCATSGTTRPRARAPRTSSRATRRCTAVAALRPPRRRYRARSLIETTRQRARRQGRPRAARPQTKGRWGNTQENAFVLLALDRYFQTTRRRRRTSSRGCGWETGTWASTPSRVAAPSAATHDVPMGILTEHVANSR